MVRALLKLGTPTTMSASPIFSMAPRASSGRARSGATSNLGGNGRLRFDRGGELLEEVGNRGNYAVPVRNRRQPEWISKKLLNCFGQAVGEGGDRQLFGVAVESQTVQHGVGVVSVDGVFSHADIAHAERPERIL